MLVALLGGVAFLESRREAQLRAEVDAVLPTLQAFVEQERGLPFRAPVEVEVLDDGDFLAALYSEPAGGTSADTGTDPEPTLNALGLLDEDVDLDAAVGESLDAGVVGFYDPATDRLVVRGQELDAFVELVLVHELTHALQDQHFDLDRPELEVAEDESGLAFDALVEGDATRIEVAWFEAQPPDRQAEIADAFGAPGDVPAGELVVEELLGFPYTAGPEYVLDLLARGGQQAVDAAFASPPTSTEQVLRPGLPPNAATPREIQRPSVGGTIVDEGVLGQLGLALLLGVDPLEPDGPADGWGGDRYVTTELDGATCTTADVIGDSPAQQAQLRAAFLEWAASQPDAQVNDGPAGAFRLKACS
jgi:hypothetical protein